MSNRERIIVYGALLLLLGLCVAALSEPGARAAAADDVGTGGEQLGPVDALALAGKEGDLVLRNAEGRLAWGEEAPSRAYSVAFVHVGRVMGPLLEAEHYQEEYERLEEELRSAGEEINERIEDFRQQHGDVQADDPDAGEISRAWQQLLQEREGFRQQANQRLGQLAAEQIERAYRDLVAAVEVVAEQRDIDLVLRFIPTANALQAPAPPQAYTGIRARIALRYPDALDITEAILEELALE